MYPEICDSRCESVMFHVAFIRVLLRNKLTFPECPSAVIRHQIHCAQQGGRLLGFIFFIIIFKQIFSLKLTKIRKKEKKKRHIFQLPKAYTHTGDLPKNRSNLITERDQIIIGYTHNIASSFISFFPQQYLFSSRCSHRIWLCLNLVVCWANLLSIDFYDTWHWDRITRCACIREHKLICNLFDQSVGTRVTQQFHTAAGQEQVWKTEGCRT